MHMKCGHKVWGVGGVKGVLMSTQGVREIGDVVRKTHHVDPLTRRKDRENVVFNELF